jgi:hypothetical protein
MDSTAGDSIANVGSVMLGVFNQDRIRELAVRLTP